MQIIFSSNLLEHLERDHSTAGRWEKRSCQDCLGCSQLKQLALDVSNYSNTSDFQGKDVDDPSNMFEPSAKSGDSEDSASKIEHVDIPPAHPNDCEGEYILFNFQFNCCLLS